MRLTKDVKRVLETAKLAPDEAWGWYFEAHKAAARLGKKHKVSTAAAAGVVAALSPQCAWERNLRDADALLADHGHKGCATYTVGVAKAVQIAQGASPLDVLRGPKERAFYRCIMRPFSDTQVCIDRHAAAVVLGRKLTPRERSFSRTLYRYYSDVYRKAAELLGVSPSSLQAACWVVERGRGKVA